MSSVAGSAARYEDFTSYVRSRQQALSRFAYLLTGNAHSAEDLVQSALAKAYGKWDRISRLEAPDAYVRRIIVNENTSWFRRARNRNEQPNSDLIELVDPVGVDTPAHDDELWRLVMTLSPQQRAAVVCRFYEDLSEAQTAQVLGCSVGAVKSHTSRALAALRTHLKDQP